MGVINSKFDPGNFTNGITQPAAAAPAPGAQPFVNQNNGQSRVSDFVQSYVTLNAMSSAGQNFMENLVSVARNVIRTASQPVLHNVNVDFTEINTSEGTYALVLNDTYFVLAMSEISKNIKFAGVPTVTPDFTHRVIKEAEAIIALHDKEFIDIYAIDPSDYGRANLFATAMINIYIAIRDPDSHLVTVGNAFRLMSDNGSNRRIHLRYSIDPAAYDNFVELYDPHAVHLSADIKLVITRDVYDSNIDSRYRGYNNQAGVNYGSMVVAVVGANVVYDYCYDGQGQAIFAPRYVIHTILSTHWHEGVMHFCLGAFARWSVEDNYAWRKIYAHEGGVDINGLGAIFDPATYNKCIDEGMKPRRASGDEIDKIIGRFTFAKNYDYLPSISLSIQQGRITMPGLKAFVPVGDAAYDAEKDRRTMEHVATFFRMDITSMFGDAVSSLFFFDNVRPFEVGGIVRSPSGEICGDIQYYSMLRAYTDSPTNANAIKEYYIAMASDPNNVDRYLQTCKYKVDCLYNNVNLIPSREYINAVRGGTGSADIECTALAVTNGIQYGIRYDNNIRTNVPNGAMASGYAGMGNGYSAYQSQVWQNNY